MFSNYKKDVIQLAVNKIGARPIDIMVTGVTGAGKSSTLNALFGMPITKVGNGVNPETMEISGYKLNDVFRIWDTPGLGDGIEKDEQHSKKIIELLNKNYKYKDKKCASIDFVLVIIEGCKRDMGTIYKLLNELILPNIPSDRVIIAVNQADQAMKGRYWNYEKNKPEENLVYFLEEQVNSIKQRVKEATGMNIIKPVYYSAQYNYNLEVLFDTILNNLPRSRRFIK